jgi:hypothetical protein
VNRRAFLAGVLVACSRSDRRASPTPTPTPTPTPDPFATARVLSGKAIGHTSVVLKLKLEGDLVAAWKPRTTRGPRRYKGEIAAHRLAVALGLANVPRAIPRAFPATELRAALVASGASALLDKEAIVKDGAIAGALIPWLDTLDFVPLEAEPWRSRWAGWLADGGDIPPDQRALAADVSTMLVFDYVTGNFDRWSGGNIGRDKTTGRLLFIDNDGAFYDVPHEAPLARQLAMVRAASRFSKSFVKSLRALDLPALRTAMGEEAPGEPLLSDGVLAGVDARRTLVLAELRGKSLYFD